MFDTQVDPNCYKILTCLAFDALKVRIAPV